ncbi:hypothetical protein GCM10010232_26620 [Streptomyces amakusaensis]|uniref:Minor tail protein n=1 Tax=Streptomyces amakusaensis TaxID=67271 RepID=A0ABW0ADW8_9ACTN
MTMWIGRPGHLRAFKEAATTFDRSPQSGTTEFRSLAGGITTWTPQIRPRRLKLAWQNMLPDDLAHLDRLARRVDGPGPVAVIDPASANWLLPSQAKGVRGGYGTSLWFGAPPVTIGGGTGAYDPVTVTVRQPDEITTFVYYGPNAGYGYPVVPGTRITWWAPSLATTAHQQRLYWIKTDGTSAGNNWTSIMDRPMTVTVPSDVAYARPAVKFNRSCRDIPVGESILRTAVPEDASLRLANRQAFSTTQQQGLAPLTQWQALAGATLSEAAGAAQVTIPGSGTFVWVPGDGKPGFPVTPGQTAVFTTSFSKIEFSGVDFLDTAGAVISGTDLSAMRAPAGAVYARPWVFASAVTTPTPIGAGSLVLWDAVPSLPAGEGTGLYSVTDYSQTVRPGMLNSRDVSLELVEVAHATG